MRTFLLPLAFVLCSAQAMNAQERELAMRPAPVKAPKPDYSSLPAIDVYGTIPLMHKGAGGGFGIFIQPLSLGIKGSVNPLQVRLGGEFYFSELSHKRLSNVPLSAPQVGDAKVRLSQSNFGLNAIARFSLPYSSILTPYIDVFGGFRGYSANMSITPYKPQPGYESSTSNNLSSDLHWTYGATGGILVSINSWLKFNTGLMYTTTGKPGEIFDISKARLENGNIVSEKINTPKDMLTLKIGLTFLIDGGFETKSSNCCNCGSSGFILGSGFSTGSFGKGNSVGFNVIPSK